MAAASAIPNCVVPKEIKNFFFTLYGKSPKVVEENGNSIYSVSGEQRVSIKIDPFRGCHVVTPQMDAWGASPPYMQKIIQEFIDRLKTSHLDPLKQPEAYDSVWIDIPFPVIANRLFSILPDSFEVGTPGHCDMVRDIQEQKVKIWQWINPTKECPIPAGATHNNGAAAVLMDRTAKKVLLIVDRHRSDHWELPGGGYDPQKDRESSETALREAVEEGGLEIDLKDFLEKIEEGALPQPTLVARRLLPYNAFAPCINEIWAYFLDGLSNKELHPPKDEILRAEWIPIDRILSGEGSFDGLPFGKEIKGSVFAAVNGVGLERVIKEERMSLHTPIIKV